MNNVNNVRFDKLIFPFKLAILFTLIITAMRLLHKNVQSIVTLKKKNYKDPFLCIRFTFYTI
jgi:hypothetical protein